MKNNFFQLLRYLENKIIVYTAPRVRQYHIRKNTLKNKRRIIQTGPGVFELSSNKHEKIFQRI